MWVRVQIGNENMRVLIWIVFSNICGCRVKKLSEKNPGQLFKWRFFRRECHLVYRFAI
jgi:hypothetical protein